MRNERADERTRTADLTSLRVINRVLQGLTGVCKSPIDKPVSLLCLASRCTVLRSRWCQNGVDRARITRRPFLHARCECRDGDLLPASERGIGWQSPLSVGPMAVSPP